MNLGTNKIPFASILLGAASLYYAFRGKDSLLTDLAKEATHRMLDTEKKEKEAPTIDINHQLPSRS